MEAREAIGENGVYRVQATVLSKSQVVKFLNATLSHNGQYITQGLKILTCSHEIPVVEPPTAPVVEVMVGAGIIGVIVVVFLIAVILCIVR